MPSSERKCIIAEETPNNSRNFLASPTAPFKNTSAKNETKRFILRKLSSLRNRPDKSTLRWTMTAMLVSCSPATRIKFNLRAIALTRGSEGSMLNRGIERSGFPSEPIEGRNTWWLIKSWLLWQPFFSSCASGWPWVRFLNAAQSRQWHIEFKITLAVGVARSLRMRNQHGRPFRNAIDDSR